MSTTEFATMTSEEKKALFLAMVAIVPFIAREVTDVQIIQMSSFGMLIVVGVVLDTMKQMEAQLVMRRYEGFLK